MLLTLWCEPGCFILIQFTKAVRVQTNFCCHLSVYFFLELSCEQPQYNHPLSTLFNEKYAVKVIRGVLSFSLDHSDFAQVVVWSGNTSNHRVAFFTLCSDPGVEIQSLLWLGCQLRISHRKRSPPPPTISKIMTTKSPWISHQAHGDNNSRYSDHLSKTMVTFWFTDFCWIYLTPSVCLCITIQFCCYSKVAWIYLSLRKLFLYTTNLNDICATPTFIISRPTRTMLRY